MQQQQPKQQQPRQNQQQERPKPDPNLVRLHDSRHYAKHTRIALAAAFAVFAVLIGAIVLWLVLTRGSAIVADRFIELITHNKIDRAYVESSSIELREQMSLEQFTDLATKLHLASVKSVSWTVQHKDAARQDLQGQIVLTDGTSETLAISFIAEFDDWKVLSFGPAAPGLASWPAIGHSFIAGTALLLGADPLARPGSSPRIRKLQS